MGTKQLAKVSKISRSAGEAALALVQSHYPGYHPLIGLARLAHDERVLADPRLELEVHRSILPYVSPKLASAELKVDSQDDRRVIVSLFEERQLEDGRTVEVEVALVRDVSDLAPIEED